MFNELKDWPRTLRINAAAGELAKALNMARCEAFGTPYILWSDLPLAFKAAYLDLATDAIRSMEHLAITFPKDS